MVGEKKLEKVVVKNKPQDNSKIKIQEVIM